MLEILVDVVRRCIGEGALAQSEPVPVALLMLSSAHGHVSLELAGGFVTPARGKAAWRAHVTAVLIGLGAEPARLDRAYRSHRSA